MVKRIVITGSESTGKTALARHLAAHYTTIYVPDYSRQYIEKLGRKYNHSDVLEIAKGIMEQENQKLHYGGRILFTDNDLINIKIWLQYYKWHVPDWLQHEIVKRKAPLYLMCDIDLPWQADDQRQNPDDREFLRNRFIEELQAIEANYHIITGKAGKREAHAIEVVDEFLRGK